MKYWLILYIMTFNAEGELVWGQWVEQPHASHQACSAALDKVIGDWERAVAGHSRSGIVGRCSDRPLSSRET